MRRSRVRISQGPPKESRESEVFLLTNYFIGLTIVRARAYRKVVLCGIRIAESGVRFSLGPFGNFFLKGVYLICYSLTLYI